MAEINYRNPAALDPYGDYRPQGFLAGWQYTDRLRDYQTMRDLSNQASSLANQRSLAELQDFKAGAPVRQMQRQHQMELMPLQHRSAMAQEEGTALGMENTIGERAASHVWQMTNQLNTERRKQLASDMIAFSSLVRGYAQPGMQMDEQSWNMILQQARKLGIDTKDFEQTDPNKVVQFFSLMDTDHLKYLRDYDVVRYKEGAETGRTREEIAGRENVARIAAGAQKETTGVAARIKEENRKRVLELLTKEREGRPLTPGEAAEIDLYRMEADPFYKYEAQAVGKAAAVGKALGTLEGQQPTPQVPPIPETTKQKEMITIEGAQYEVIERLPNGQIRIRDPRSGRTGVWGR